MYWFPLLLLAIVLALSHESPRLHAKGMSAKMVSDGVDTPRIHHYVRLENQLHDIEQQSIETGENRVHEAMCVSKRIRDDFPMYDFTGHAEILKRVAEPHKHYKR